MRSADEILAENEEFFAPIGPTLSNLARKFHLCLERYQKDAPCWSLCFSQPHGGLAKVEVCRASDTTVRIVGIWWVDDYDCGTRSLKGTAKAEVELQPSLVEKSVVTALKAIIGSKPGEWTQVATGYSAFWHRTWTKEQFEQFQHSDKFPAPTFESVL